MKNDEGDVGVINDSVLHVLKENCRIGAKKQTVPRKCGRTIAPGKRIVSLDSEDAPGSSKENVNPVSKKKKATKNVEKKINLKEDLWICSDQGCGEEWDDKSNNCWVVCDSCGDKIPLAALRNWV